MSGVSTPRDIVAASVLHVLDLINPDSSKTTKHLLAICFLQPARKTLLNRAICDSMSYMRLSDNDNLRFDIFSTLGVGELPSFTL